MAKLRQVVNDDRIAWLNFFLKAASLGATTYIGIGFMYGDSLYEQRASLGEGWYDFFRYLCLNAIIYLYTFSKAHPHIYSFILPIFYSVFSLLVWFMTSYFKTKSQYNEDKELLSESGIQYFSREFSNSDLSKLYSSEFLGKSTGSLDILCINGAQIRKNLKLKQVIEQHNGQINVLIYNPNETTEFLRKRAAKNKCTVEKYRTKQDDNISFLKKLGATKNLEVREYTSMPSFRLIFSNNFCLVQGYHTGIDENMPIFGLHQLSGNNQGLYEIFQSYFYVLWGANAKNVIISSQAQKDS